MVKKLFKHEMLAYIRILLPAWAVLLGVALFGRLIQIFEQDTIVYEIISISSVVIYVVGLIAALAFPLVFGIQRFYKNLFSGEGYLSFTLPVTPFQHIFVKVVTAVTMSLATFLVMLVSVTVFTFGDMLNELLKASGYLLNMLFRSDEAVHIVLWCAEFLVFLIVALFATFLLYDTCIAIGQTFKKNRVLGAVGVYFIYYAITQVVGTVVVVVGTLLPVEWYETLLAFAETHVRLCIHLLLCGGIVWMAIMTCVYFLITHTIIRKKLNLE